MSPLPLVKVPNDVLTTKAKPIMAVDGQILALAADMAETMVKERGVGLAAPQIGKSLQLFVVAHRDGYKIFINPEIYWTSLLTDVEEEGCLSIPGVYGMVRRHKSIKIRYTDENGQLRDEKVSGFFARVVQHENDHINGILITDRFLK